MAASSLTWAGKKLTPTELINSLRTDPLPLVVKVAQVTNEYEKSCPQMATGTVHWIYGTAKEARVALKTTDRNAKYISIPCDAPIKFAVVHTHERGPPTLLSNMLKGKAQSDLRVEMAGNTGNRLSSTPDQAQSIPYGTLQVVGIYNETVLQAQTVVNVVGELNPLRRNISVNCPVSFDIATGIYGKSSEDFRKLKERLKQSQTSRASNQADTSFDVALLSGVPKSLQDVHLLRHTCQLSSTASLRSTAAEAVGSGTQSSSSTVFESAVARLTDKVGSDIIGKAKSRESIHLGNHSGMKLSAARDADVRCYYVESAPQRQRTSDTYENEEGLSAESRARAERGRDGGVEKRWSKPPPLGGLKDGVYVKDWKQKEMEKLTKGTVAQPPPVPSSTHTAPPLPPAVPLSPAVPSPPAVPLPPALRSPRAVALPVELDDDNLEDYEVPVETDKRATLPLPRIPSDSTQKAATRGSSTVFAHSVKPATEKQTNFKSVFSGIKNKLVKSLPKKSSSSQSPTSPQGKWPAVDDGSDLYDDLYDQPEEEGPIRKGSGKEGGNKDSDSEEDYEIPVEDSKWKTLSEVPKNIKNFTISDVSLCLQLLNFAKYVTPFRERSVDGALLKKLDQKTLVQMFKMQEFEAKQLVTFAKDNWRPKL